MPDKPQTAVAHPVRPPFRWQVNAKLVLLVAVLLPLTVRLGFWQLDRAEQKSELLQTYEQRSTASPVTLDEMPPGDDQQYRRIHLTGTLDNERTLLLDNRVRRGQQGYEVVSLFRPAGRPEWLAVNRGWLPGGLDRSRLPVVPEVVNPVTLSGFLYLSPGRPLRLGAEKWTGRWPQVLQNLDLDELATKTGLPVFPWQMRLEQESPAVLLADWAVVNVLPEKHHGYAVQWFAMALALVILAIFANSNLGQVLVAKKRQRPQ